MRTVDLSAREIARRVNAGVTSREAVVRDYLEIINAMEAGVGAFSFLSSEHVLEEARVSDRIGVAGMLAGVPFAAKDIIDTSDMPTTYGSAVYAGNQPQADAAVVALARRAGATLLGKTTSTEFALVAPTETRNPYNREHTPGGSSSGSAAAVSAGMVPVALGTQTAGSTIRPASFCGVVGFKPTFGLVDRSGIKTLAQGLDTVGILSRSVDDAALFVAALTSRPELANVDAIAPCIGMLRFSALEEADDATIAILEATARHAERSGATLRAVDAPGWFDNLAEAHKVVMGYEVPTALAHELRLWCDQLKPQTVDYIARIASGVTAACYDKQRALVRNARACLSQLFGSTEVLLVPAAPGEAPRGLNSTGHATFNIPWTLLHAPCITIPAGRGPNGLPIGVQLVAKVGDDAHLLAAAKFIEEALKG
jgi:amidase